MYSLSTPKQYHKNQCALTVADILVKNWFYQFGVSTNIHSEQGCKFEMFDMFGIWRKYGMNQVEHYRLETLNNYKALMLGMLRSIGRQSVSADNHIL